MGFLKQCSKCDKIKYWFEFFKNKSGPFSLKSECKKCSQKAIKAAGYKRAPRDKEYYQKHRVKLLAAQNKYRKLVIAINKITDYSDKSFKCTGCEKTKRWGEFRKNTSKKFGIEKRCHECAKKHDKRIRKYYPENHLKWREKNREYLAKTSKIYYAKNKKEILAKAKIYRSKNIEKIKAIVQKYASKPETKAKVSKYRKKYYQENKERLKKWHANYNITHKDLMHASQKKYYEKHKIFINLTRRHKILFGYASIKELRQNKNLKDAFELNERSPK